MRAPVGLQRPPALCGCIRRIRGTSPMGPRTRTARCKAVYLTGSHTWNNLVDMGRATRRPPFDFDAYLDFLEPHGHNFIRLWTWDRHLGHAVPTATGKDSSITSPRCPGRGPGRAMALDGKPKFDLTKFDPAYFDRLRAARRRRRRARHLRLGDALRGLGLASASRRTGAMAWHGHPFHPDNNINGINGDPNGDGNVAGVHSLASAGRHRDPRRPTSARSSTRSTTWTTCSTRSPTRAATQEWDWWVVKTVTRLRARPSPSSIRSGSRATAARRSATMLASPADWISPGRSGRLPRRPAGVGRPEGQPPGHRPRLGRRRQPGLGVEELPARAQPDLHGPLRRLNPG